VSPEQLAIRVTDDGPGIVAPDLERLFEPFFTTKPAGQGTGLGLAIARAAIEAHGGHLWLDRSWQSGARFVVALPWRPATHRSEEALARDAC
jgi:signal transduction histidine kinase